MDPFFVRSWASLWLIDLRLRRSRARIGDIGGLTSATERSRPRRSESGQSTGIRFIVGIRVNGRARGDPTGAEASAETASSSLLPAAKAGRRRPVSLPGFGDGQDEPKGGAGADLAVDADGPAVRADDAPRDGQAQAGGFLPACRPGLRARVRFEKSGLSSAKSTKSCA